MVKFKIVRVFENPARYDFDDSYSNSDMLMMGHAEWEECDESTFAEIVKGAALINAKTSGFFYSVVEMPSEQTELVSLFHKEFLKHVKKLEKEAADRQKAKDVRAEQEKQKKLDRERKKFLKLKALFEPVEGSAENVSE